MVKVTKKYDNLAQLVFHTREKLGLSISGLSKKSNLDEAVILNIEAGLELFLQTTVRQKLAKGLCISLDEIKIYEKGENDDFISPQILDELRQDILFNADNKAYAVFCPICGAKLITRIAKLHDLEDNLVLHPKARCSKCPFQLHS